MKKLFFILAAFTLLFCFAVSAQAAVGDTDDNGRISASDARYVLRAAVQLEHPNEALSRRCDVDHSGKITAADARLVLRVAVKLDQFTHPALTGAEETLYYKPATCTEPGSRSYLCACGDAIRVELPAAGHVPSAAKTEKYKKSTCTQAGGYDSVVYCSVCKKELSREHVMLELLPHVPGDPVEEGRVEPTCANQGAYALVSYCTVCGEEVSRENVILPKLPHTPGAAVKENEVLPTCTEPGGFDTAVYCTVCREELSRTHQEIPATGHLSILPAEAPEAYIGAGPIPQSEAYYRCADCGMYFEDSAGTKPLAGLTLTLTEAMKKAAEGQTVVLLKDVTLTENAAVPAGVTLVLPYGYGSNEFFVNPAQANLPYANAAPNGAISAVTGAGEQVRVCLTLSGCALSVEKGAVLAVGGQYSGLQPISGGTYGSHAEILVEKGASLKVSGVLSTYGYITGEGELTLTGGELYEPMIVTDYHGGTYSASSYYRDQAPFNAYACVNVQCPVVMDSDSSVYGYCVLYALGMQYGATSVLISSDQGFLSPQPGASLRFSYDGTKAVDGYYGLGRVNITVQGNVNVQQMTIVVFAAPMPTSSILFPVPHYFSYTQSSGTLSVNQGITLMPGSEVTICENAALQVNETLCVMDGFTPGQYSAYHYPSGEKLSAAGLPERARLTVNGAMVIADGAKFAGIVETNGFGIVSLADNCELSALIIDGLIKNEKINWLVPICTSKVECRLIARLADGEGHFFTMQAGKTYTAVSAAENTLDGYEYVKYSGEFGSASAENVTVVYASPQVVCGAWRAEES